VSRAGLRESRIRTLVLYAQYTSRLSYYDDWLDAFRSAPEFAIAAHNIAARREHAAIAEAIEAAELIVLLHSTNGDTTEYIEPFAGALQNRRGRLVTFVGNELNLPGSPIRAKRDLFRRITPDFVATQMLVEAGEYLFADVARSRVIALPHALNPEAFRPVVEHAKRAFAIGVRAVHYVAHLGDDDRNRLHDYFARRDFGPDFRVDISAERLNRTGWADFLNNCCGTISSEAGSWYLERDDATVTAIRQYLRETRGSGWIIANDSPWRRLGHKLPWPVRAALRQILRRGLLRHESAVNEDAPFPEIHARFFADKPRSPVYGKCISSRHFDAIGTKTCQIMFPGRFNDILVADEHYIALQPDFSNIDEVMRRFRDVGYRLAMVDRAHAYVMEHHTYRHRIAELLRQLGH
jgi:hypothetical protein